MEIQIYLILFNKTCNHCFDEILAGLTMVSRISNKKIDTLTFKKLFIKYSIKIVVNFFYHKIANFLLLIFLVLDHKLAPNGSSKAKFTFRWSGFFQRCRHLICFVKPALYFCELSVLRHILRKKVPTKMHTKCFLSQ